MCVESVAAQALLSHFLRVSKDRIPVRDFTTGRGLEWQAELLAGELSDGRWLFPSDDGRPNHPEVNALCRDLLYYTPTAHCPDRLAAFSYRTNSDSDIESKLSRPRFRRNSHLQR